MICSWPRPSSSREEPPLEIGSTSSILLACPGVKAVVPPRVKEPPHEGCPREVCHRRRDQVGGGDGQLERRDHRGGDGSRDGPAAAAP